MESGFYGLLGIAARMFFIGSAYKLGYAAGAIAGSSKLMAYLTAVGIAAFLGVGAASRPGTQTEDADPLYGGGDRVVDYSPSSAQPNEHGWLVSFVVAVPACIGIHKGRPGADGGYEKTVET